MEMVTVKLFGIEQIRNMMGATEPIEGCMIVQVRLKRKQIAFTNERPDDDVQWFEYETEPRDCLSLFEQKPVYGVLLGDVEGSAHDVVPIAMLAQTRYVHFGVACFRRDGEERRLFLNIDDRAYYVLKRDSLMKLGDRIIVQFAHDLKKVEWAKAHGGKFFGLLKAWVFPADVEGIEEVLLK
jgi:hypothetical protein